MAHYLLLRILAPAFLKTTTILIYMVRPILSAVKVNQRG